MRDDANIVVFESETKDERTFDNVRSVSFV